MQAVNANSLCRFCPNLPALSPVSGGDRDRVVDLGSGSDPGPGAQADQGMVRGISGQNVGGPTFCVGVECGVCVERCPFDVPTFRGDAKMHADARHRTAAMFEDRAA